MAPPPEVRIGPFLNPSHHLHTYRNSSELLDIYFNTFCFTECPMPANFSVNITISIIIIILLLLGVVGNTVTLIVIARNKNLQTNFNIFLISLCISDLVSACVCSPLWLYRRTWGYEEWLWGQALCEYLMFRLTVHQASTRF